MSNSKELIDYIDKVKKVIDKVKQIELFFKEINNEEQNGGGENKLHKYKIAKMLSIIRLPNLNEWNKIKNRIQQHL